MKLTAATLNEAPSEDLETIISEGLARKMSEGMGYSLPDERITRMAADFRSMVPHVGGAIAIAEAFEMELLLYGDPNVTPFKVIGLLGVSN